MPNPSPYLSATLSRWKDRNALIRRDVDIMLEGLKVKGLLLGDLRQKVRKHRLEDVAQLKDARQQTWTQWDERIKRLEGWMGQAAVLHNAAANVVAWKKSTVGFDRAQELGRKYIAMLGKKAGRLEGRVVQLGERLQQWSERLRAMETDLGAFAARHADKAAEVLVSKARKRPYLDFVYVERETEGRMALEFKSIRATVNLALERIARADQWAGERAAANPSYFEDRKNELVRTWAPFRKRFGDLRDAVLQQALEFEEGRKRLRWIYDQVQRMRVVQEIVPTRKPLLERLFQPKDE